MEIPKNTTQVGEVHGNYKIFIEDYVISYLKQLCRQEPDRKKRIAFYGVLRTEESQQYFFVYGGCEVPRHGRNDTYLTEQDYEEITWAGAKHFEACVPLGFITIEEELPEGIYLFFSGREIYVKGYHIFYEKNENMLAFMIHRQAASQTAMQTVKEEKKQELPQERGGAKDEASLPEGAKKADFQASDRRQKEKPQEKGRTENSRFGRSQPDREQGEIRLFGIIKSAAAALFIVLCVTAVSTMNGLGKIEGLQNFFQKAFQTMTEKKLPDKEQDNVPASAELVVEEAEPMPEENASMDLLDKMQQENENSAAGAAGQPVESQDTLQETQEPQASDEPDGGESVETIRAEEHKTYVIRKGDTLIGISRSYYGDDSRVQEICDLNGILNSDNIQVGQKIILP